MRYRYSRFLPGFILSCDLLLLNLALFYPVYLAMRSTMQHNLMLLVLADVCWVALSPVFKVYRVSRPPLLIDDMRKLFITALPHFIVIGTVCHFYWPAAVRLQDLLLSYLIFSGLVMAHRYTLSNFLDHIRRHGYNCRNILILGDQPVAKALAAHFSVHPEYGYDLINDDLGEAIVSYSNEEIVARVLDKDPDEIFVCYTDARPGFLDTLAEAAAGRGIIIKQVPSLILTDSYARIVNYHHLPDLQLRQDVDLKRYVRIAKRGFDIGFSSVALVGAAPVIGILYVITRFTSRGPGYYMQERIGLNGKPFKIIKFRSMYIDAEAGGPQLACHNDPRVTPWGRVMRRTRLDELPQFWNVLKGDMSVVGPRPERRYFIDQIAARNPQYKRLMAIKPGITSMGQVHYGYAENVDQMCERMEYDLLYLKGIGLRADLRVIAHTIKVMVLGKGM